MDAQRRAEELITEALARGDLEPREGVGTPFGPMDDDPDWWVRSLLEREKLPERFEEAVGRVGALVERAIAADALDDARRLFAQANRVARRWNDGSPDAYRIPTRTEVWLLDQRAGRPGETPGVRHGGGLAS
jgi:hypothetical protein